jgi:hypothetical protein
MKQFYSYLWLRVDGTPYYVGKGTGRRAFTPHGHRISCPQERSRIIVFPMLNEVEAFESEIALIELFGRKDLGTGCLRNLTNGGENPPSAKGLKRAESTLQKMRQAQKGHHRNLGSKRSPETKEKMRLAQLGKKHSAAAIEHMRRVRANVPQETRSKISIALRGRPTYVRTPEIKQKMSEVGKLGWVKRKQKS